MKARHCDECCHFDLKEDEFGRPIPPVCLKGHRPRFYMPKGPMDGDWGYKRRCEDFEEPDPPPPRPWPPKEPQK